ncbi:hypothetical protein RP20_CCG006796 [Aedes albopictus]|nr:hypothetical protein RP20_CCG006796 [Aedes albopictus]
MFETFKQALRYDSSSNPLKHLMILHRIIGFNLSSPLANKVSRLSMILAGMHALCFVYRVYMVSKKDLGFEYYIAALNVVGGYIFAVIRMTGFAWNYDGFRRICRFLQDHAFQRNDLRAQRLREQCYGNNQKFTIGMLVASVHAIMFFILTDYRTTDQYEIPFELSFLHSAIKSTFNALFGLYLYVIASYFWIPFITIRVVIHTLCVELEIANKAFGKLFTVASDRADLLMTHHSASSSRSVQLADQLKADLFWLSLRSELRELVDHHRELLINVDRLCQLAAMPFLSETMSCILISSISVFFLLNGESLSLVAISCVLMFESFYASSLVEALQDVHGEMGTVIYALAWPSEMRYDRRNHRHYKYVSRVLQVVLMRSQRRLRFHCGGLFEMSRATFTFTVKTCYTMLTFLLRMQDV